MRIRKATTVVGLAVLLAATTTIIFAKDSITVNLSKATGSPVIVNNGQAVGTIQLFYTVNDFQFTTGTFATFDVNWLDTLDSKNPTNYGSGISFDLIQDQQGGNVDLSTNSPSFLLTGAGQHGVSTVTVSITNDKHGNPPPSIDGTDLVGNLKLDAGSKVGSVTNIQVHIRLVHPTSSSCLKVYNFVTDQDFTMGILPTTNLNVPTNGSKAGKVVSSQPGSFSDNVLIVNTCGIAESFDLGIALDPSFQTAPNGNPGNAVFSYNAAGEFDTSNFNPLLTGTKTPNQQNLCLQNVTVAAGTSFLATVHSRVRDNWPQSSLPTDRTFDFGASLYQNVNTGCTSPLNVLAEPNPATSTLPFTINGA